MVPSPHRPGSALPDHVPALAAPQAAALPIDGRGSSPPEVPSCEAAEALWGPPFY